MLSKELTFWTVVLEKTLESPLDCKEIQPIHPKGDQSWVFIGRTDVEAETPILWPPDANSWLIWKDPDAGKDWRWEGKGMTEDGMVGWHHQLNECEFEWTSGVGDGQGGLACCSPWGRKESDTVELLNWTDPSDQAIKGLPFPHTPLTSSSPTGWFFFPMLKWSCSHWTPCATSNTRLCAYVMCLFRIKHDFSLYHCLWYVLPIGVCHLSCLPTFPVALTWLLA